MSSVQVEEKTKCQKVLVQAFGGEPVAMYAVATQGDLVDVSRNSGAEYLPVKREFVREDNARRARMMSEAYNNGEKDVLRSLWAEAKPF